LDQRRFISFNADRALAVFLLAGKLFFPPPPAASQAGSRGLAAPAKDAKDKAGPNPAAAGGRRQKE